MTRDVPVPDTVPFQMLVTVAPDGSPKEMRVSDAGVAPMFCTTNLPHQPPLHEESTCTRMLTLPGAGAGLGVGAGVGVGVGVGVGAGAGVGVGVGAGVVPVPGA